MMASSTSVHRIARTVLIFCVILCFISTQSGLIHGATALPTEQSAQPALSAPHAETLPVVPADDFRVHIAEMKAWRQAHEDALNRVLSPPLVSGMLTGDSTKRTRGTKAASTASSRPEEVALDKAVRRAVSDDVNATSPFNSAPRVTKHPLQLVRVVSNEAAYGATEKNTSDVDAEVHAELEKTTTRALQALRQMGHAAHTQLAADRRADTHDAASVAPLAASKDVTVVIPDNGAMMSGHAVRVPITAVGESYNVIQFTGEQGHTVSAIVQLRSHQYEPAVPESNCNGMYVNVELRNNWKRPGSVPTPQDNTTETVAAGSDSVWAQLWDPIVQLFDISIFCRVVSSLSMRIDNVPRTEPFYLVVKSGISSDAYYSYAVSEANFSCQMEVYISQTSTKRAKLMHTLFALVLPLIILVVPLPFTLWRTDIIQQLIGDVDFGEWLWFIPYYMRYLIIKGAVGAYNVVYEWRLERRTQATQRALEQRHRELMRAGSATTATEVVVAGTGTEGPYANGNNNNNNNNNNTDAPKSEPPLVTGREGHHAGGGRLDFDDDDDAGLRPRVPGMRTGAREFGVGPVHDADATAAAAAPASHGVGEDDTLDLMERFNQPATTVAAPPTQPRAREEFSAASSTTASIAVGDARRGLTEDGSPLSMAPEEDEAAVHEAPSSPTRTGAGRARGAASGRAYLFTAGPTTDNSVGLPAETVVSTDAASISIAVAEGGATAMAVPPAPVPTPSRTAPREEAEATAAAEEDEEEEKFCRICRDGEEMESLIAPCQCTGSVRWIHRSCLDHWRLESAKRNLTNVNNCEICKQPFTIGIKRSTLFWQSSRQFIRSSILVFTSVSLFILVVVLSHSVIGELSCTGVNHQVAYSAMFSFQGMVVSVFNYSLLVFMVMFAHLIVYSWFRGRPDVEEYVNEMHMIPPFWTRWNGLKIVGVSIILCAQAISTGYLIKYIFYVTSNAVWNWELSPFLGSTCLMFIYSCIMGPAEGIRECVIRAREARRRRRGVSAEDVVIETEAADTTAAVDNNNSTTTTSADVPAGGRAPLTARADVDVTDADFTRQFDVPPEQRVIRAMEYCPPHRAPPKM